jgi:Holliday junction resolvasome RuvABC DNA-binding subunit
LGCSGIGPKISLAVLHDLGVMSFLQSVHTGTLEPLSQVTGIGPKKAEQIFVNLKHKIAKLVAHGVLQDGFPDFSTWHELAQTLKALNYEKHEISNAMDYLKRTRSDKDISFDQQLRTCLAYLSKQS